MAKPKKDSKLKFPGMPDEQYRVHLERLRQADAALAKRPRVRKG